MNNRKRTCRSFLAFFLLCVAACMAAPGVLAAGEASAPDFGPAYPDDDTLLIPHVYGKTVYRSNEESPNQLYIIGMSHRDSLTRINGDTTVISQMEVYRIAEWLIQNQGLELLLPEGFFLKKTDTLLDADMPLSTEGSRAAQSVDSATLKNRLQDDMVYVNAEMLIMQSHGIRVHQVEDNDLYHAVQRGIIMLEKSGHHTFEYLFEKAKLDYLQERRTAAMLQKIPDIVSEEFMNGSITNRKAIFTVGLNHVPAIIKYLEENRIEIDSPAFVTSCDDYRADVKLFQEDYGVTIIIPRSLAESRQMLRLTRREQTL